MQSSRIFPYHWYIDETEKYVTCIRIYGLNENDENVCLRVDDFTPYAYVELPTENVTWTESLAQNVGDKINDLMSSKTSNGKIIDDHRPLKKQLMWKKKLYGAHLNENGDHRLFPFLFCSFSSTADVRILGYKLNKPINIMGVGSINLKLHETSANPILQLTCCAGLSTGLTCLCRANVNWSNWSFWLCLVVKARLVKNLYF